MKFIKQIWFFRPNGYVTSITHPDAHIVVIERGYVGPADVSHVATHLGDDGRRVHAITPASRCPSASGPYFLVRIRVCAGIAASADLIVHTQRIFERSSQSEFSTDGRGLLQLQSILIYFQRQIYFFNCIVTRSYIKDSTTKNTEVPFLHAHSKKCHKKVSQFCHDIVHMPKVNKKTSLIKRQLIIVLPDGVFFVWNLDLLFFAKVNEKTMRKPKNRRYCVKNIFFFNLKKPPNHFCNKSTWITFASSILLILNTKKTRTKVT